MCSQNLSLSFWAQAWTTLSSIPCDWCSYVTQVQAKDYEQKTYVLLGPSKAHTADTPPFSLTARRKKKSSKDPGLMWPQTERSLDLRGQIPRKKGSSLKWLMCCGLCWWKDEKPRRKSTRKKWFRRSLGAFWEEWNKIKTRFAKKTKIPERRGVSLFSS